MLYDKVCREDILRHAYALARANAGAPGVDGVTFADIDLSGREAWWNWSRRCIGLRLLLLRLRHSHLYAKLSACAPVLGVEASTSLKPSWRLCTGAPVEAESAPSAIAFQAIE
jgi:hypothetical protein